MSKFKKLSALVLVGILLIASLSGLSKVSALGTLAHSSVLETGGTSNANPGIVSDGQQVAFDFTPATTVSSGYTVTLTFGAGGTLWTQTSTPTSTSGVVAASGQTVAAGNCTTLFAANTPTFLPGTLGVASSQAAGTITITSTGSGDTITSGTNYCATLTLVTAVTNPTGSAVYPVSITTTSDTQTDAIDVLSSGANAYSITGTITPSFTMSLSGSTDTFASNLSSSAVVVSTGITTTIQTNAKTGWFLWADDANAGLHSTIASKTIASVTAGTAYTFSSNTGTEGYGLGAVTSGTETGITNATPYAYAGGTTGSGLSNTAYNLIASATGPASGSTGSATDSIVTHELANISPTTPPATDYTDTITLIGAGSF